MTVEGAALAFEILSTGISALSQGDIEYTGPTSEIGVLAPGLPDNIRQGLRTHTKHHEVFSYSRDSNGGVELVNVKLECILQWNGPEVQATFSFPADGMRSRLLNDTKVSIRNPVSLERLDAPDAWKAIGVAQYPIVRIPISIFVDHPFPADNYKVSFDLLVSGMYGFGTDTMSMFQEYREHWD
jgi:hypothetical protein